MATLTYNSRKIRFEWIGQYEDRHEPKAARFRWDPDARVWWTDSLDKAARLREYADEQAAAHLPETNGATVAQSRQLSRATDAEISVPSPQGLSYMPFQRAGIAYASSRPATLIGDEMGLGKTIQAIGVINSDESVAKVLVVCPASLKINWQRELEKWLVRPLTIGIANGGDLPDTQVVIVNYDILKKHHDALRRGTWDLLIVDECHYTKNRQAQRTAEVWGKRAKKAGKWGWDVEPIDARRKLALTGTPLVNRPVELFPILNGLAPADWPSFMGFAQRYCGAHKNRWGWDFTGATNLDELQDRLRSTLMIRRLKKDVLTDLPPKIRQVIELPTNGLKPIVDAENAAFEQHRELVEQLHAALDAAEIAKDKAKYAEIVEQLKAAIAVAFSSMSRVRRETAVAKVPQVLAHLLDVLDEDGRQLVVFAHHHEVVSQLVSGLDAKGHRTVVVTGRTPQAERQAAVDAFMSGTARVFIGNIIAAGVGLTLTAASHVVFAEMDWVPGNVTQAEDRCHRIGQRDTVLVQHLVLAGSLDAKMARMIVRKQDVIDAALDDERPIEATSPAASKPAPVTEELGADLFIAIVQMMQRAHEHEDGLAYPTINLKLSADGQRVQLARCGEKSRYEGDIRVTDGGKYGESIYFGRIERTGTLVRGKQCTDEVVEVLRAFVKDPVATAKLYGKLARQCCFCNRQLTHPNSIAEGYGPKCADRYGLPWGGHEHEDTTVEVDL